MKKKKKRGGEKVKENTGKEMGQAQTKPRLFVWVCGYCRITHSKIKIGNKQRRRRRKGAGGRSKVCAEENKSKAGIRWKNKRPSAAAEGFISNLKSKSP